MPVVHPNAAGIDIGSQFHVVSVPPDRDSEPVQTFKSFRGNPINFDIRTELYNFLRVDLTEIHGIGSTLALKLIAECGTDMSRWPTSKHFTSWLCLAPANKIFGGRVLSSRTRKSNNRLAAMLRLAAVVLGKTDSALGAFYRRLAARAGKAVAVTATARKIATIFYNTLRYGIEYADPGADYYDEKYKARALEGLRRRADAFGFTLQEKPVAVMA